MKFLRGISVSNCSDSDKVDCNKLRFVIGSARSWCSYIEYRILIRLLFCLYFNSKLFIYS